MTSTVVGKRNVFDFAPQELNVLDPGLRFVLIREGQHFIRHVETEGFPRRTNTLGGKQNVNPTAGAKVEHGLTGLQFGKRRWVAATKRRQHGSLG